MGRRRRSVPAQTLNPQFRAAAAALRFPRVESRASSGLSGGVLTPSADQARSRARVKLRRRDARPHAQRQRPKPTPALPTGGAQPRSSGPCESMVTSVAIPEAWHSHSECVSPPWRCRWARCRRQRRTILRAGVPRRLAHSMNSTRLTAMRGGPAGAGRTGPGAVIAASGSVVYGVHLSTVTRWLDRIQREIAS